MGTILPYPLSFFTCFQHADVINSLQEFFCNSQMSINQAIPCKLAHSTSKAALINII